MEPLFELRLEPITKGARDGAVNLHRQLKAAILDGRLVTGSRLPPTRSANVHFGVSRNTVMEVYERLLHEGLVEARHGSGTFVASVTPAVRTPSALEGSTPIDDRLNAFWLSEETEQGMGYWQTADEPKAAGDRPIDLRPAVVDTRYFPFDRLRQAFTLKLRHMEQRPASNRAPKGNQGNYQLRSAIAAHVGVTRAVAVAPEEILVTSGAQQAFDLIARVLVRPGRTVVAVENPGYPPMRIPFAAMGAAIAPVPVDEEGIRVDLIPADAAMICLTPSHQFPLGVPLSAARRAELLRFARRNGAVIVEDDYDGEFRYDGSPLTALRADDASDVVFYVGTFSKTMLPSLRLGFLIPPRWALASLIAAKNALDWHVSSPLQLGVAGFISDGHLTRHVARMRQVYGDRRRTVLDVVNRAMPADIRALPSFHGMHVTIVSDADRDLEQIATSAAGAGLQMHGLKRYHVGKPAGSGMVIGFGAAEPAEITTAMGVLANLLRPA